MADRHTTTFRLTLAVLFLAVGLVAASMIHPRPHQRPWCETLADADGRVTPVPQRGWVGQPIPAPGAGLDWLFPLLGTNDSAAGCAVEVALLAGDSPPTDDLERADRQRATWIVEGEQMGRVGSLDLPRGVARELAPGQPLYLLLRRVDSSPTCVVSVVMNQPQDAATPPAQQLRDGSAGLIARDLPGSLVLLTGSSARSSLLRRPAVWFTLPVLVAIALGLALAGPRPEQLIPASPSPTRSPWARRAAGATFLAAALAVVAFHDDAGRTWDAHYHMVYGEQVLEYYTSGLRDTSALTYRNNFLYGGAFDLLAALAIHASPLPAHETVHLVCGLVALAGLVGVWFLARELAGERAALWAALLLATTPLYVGHAFNNPKDLPFAAGYVWGVALLVRLVRRWPRVSLGTAAALGVAIGWAAGVRVAGMLLLVYLLLFVAGVVALAALRPGSTSAALRQVAMPSLRAVLPAGLIGYGGMLLAWPWAQQNPLVNPLSASSVMARFPWGGIVLYRGRYFHAQDLPMDYVPRLLAQQLPELVLLGLVAAAALGLAALFVARRRAGAALPAAAMVALAIIAPAVLVVALESTLYQGVRQMLFLVPPLVAVAAVGLDRVRSICARWRPAAGAAATAVLVLLWLLAAVPLVRLHPYQQVHFNRLVGGVAGAQDRHDLADYRSSGTEAVALLAEALRTEGQAAADPTYTVNTVAHATTIVTELPPELHWTNDRRGADFFVVSACGTCGRVWDGEVMLAVERLGIPLTYVYDRREVTRADQRHRPDAR